MTNISEKIAKRKRNMRILLAVLAVFVLVCVGMGIYLLSLWKNGERLNRETMFVSEASQDITFERGDAEASATPTTVPAQYDGKPTVKHGDKYYVLNDDIFSILFMGVDVDDDEQFENIGVTAHQSDTLILAAIDPEQNKLTIINVPRMTITDVKQLDAAFNYARTTRSPICIQYAFGDGKALSCTLTRDAVSNLLFNIPISRYVSMNLDGLYTANDALGGVTVTLLDDMTEFNRKMKKGVEYTLRGRDAEIYLTSRTGKGLDGTNMSRTRRHIQYYKAFFATAKNKLKADPMFAINLYGSMGSSVQTDMSMEEMMYLSRAVINMDISDENIHTLAGTVKNEDFFVDDEALKELLITVFYTEVPQ